MRIILLVLAFAAYYLGYVLLQRAESTFHENSAMIVFLIGSVFLCGAALVEAINGQTKKLLKAIQSTPEPADDPVEATEPLPIATAPLTPANSPTPPIAVPAEGNQTSNETKAEALFAEAREMVSSGNRKAAVSKLGELVKTYPQTKAAAKAKKSLQIRG